MSCTITEIAGQGNNRMLALKPNSRCSFIFIFKGLLYVRKSKETNIHATRQKVKDKKSLVKFSLHGFLSVRLTDVRLELLDRRILIQNCIRIKTVIEMNDRKTRKCMIAYYYLTLPK